MDLRLFICISLLYNIVRCECPTTFTDIPTQKYFDENLVSSFFLIDDNDIQFICYTKKSW